MSTVLIVLLVVVAALAIAGALYARRSRGGVGGRTLRQRFGPEYERVLARHNGDPKATERELRARVDQYGDLTPTPLPVGGHEAYLSRWTVVQERFVASPQQAVTEAEALLGQLAADRGFPAAGQHDRQSEALSVHHPFQVDGHRLLHAATLGEMTTEQLREAMVRGRALYDALLGEGAGAAPGTPGIAAPRTSEGPLGGTGPGGASRITGERK
ncbi:hypothetical protein [Streptomyces phytohabitans]|uniref:hypothetical protein n=1 Tax=Streptomyces phytohabitans TaxID=1150371 RepID=UPI00345BA920